MITQDQFTKLYPRASTEIQQAFLTQSPQVFEQYGLNAGLNRLYYFLAQVGHESGGLTITRENLNYSAQRLTQVWPGRFPTLASAQPYADNPEKLANFVYANRMGNGPPKSGDGYRYRGRGFIQITGREAYQALGKTTGLDLIGNPDEAFTAASALTVACGFWKWKKLNPVCDSGDFTKVTKLINGGVNGLADRQAWLDKVQRVLGEPATPIDPDDPKVVIAVQRALRTKGYTEVGAADGMVGPRTRAAIAHYRQKTGLPDGDTIDATLVTALGITL